MTDAPLSQNAAETPRDRCLKLIEAIVQATLKGKIRAREQVYQMLRQGVSPGTGEIFERVLGDRLRQTQEQANTLTDELKLAKANRTLKALQTIQSEWERVQTEAWDRELIGVAVQEILVAAGPQRLAALLQVLDPNRTQSLQLPQLKQLASLLQTEAEAITTGDRQELQQLAAGMLAGLEAWQRLEGHLVSWIYEQGRGQLGFEGVPGQQGPWEL